MTSEERREIRFQRRRSARQARRAERNRDYDDFDKVFSFENLYRSYRKCRCGVSWKASVQKYIVQAPLEVYKTYRRLHTGKYRSPGFHEFELFERGKHRHIRSCTFAERVVQRTLCDNALVPVLGASLIHDNGATMPKKGYDFAIRRFEQHIREHYRKYGTKGYVLTFDFSSFFDNVSHEVLRDILRQNFTDERILRLTEHLIGMFGERGLGLGSQISQVLALVSANRLDHYIKEVLRFRGYGRYMDDGYLVSPTREKLQKALIEIKRICSELGIVLSEKKTHIWKITRVTWLKTRFYLTETGKVIKKIYRRSVTVMRRKLKKLHRKMEAGLLVFMDIARGYLSWDGYARRFDAWHTRASMLNLFVSLYHEEVIESGVYKSFRP